MTVRQVYNPKNNQIIINLPETFKGKKHVVVTIDDAVDTKAEKFLQIKNAAFDPLFLADVKSINDDFERLEDEIL